MEKVNIQFKGMTNIPDDGFNEVGDMSVLLNTRHKGGELVQCQTPDDSWSIPNMKQMLFHQNSGYWLMLDNDGKLQVYKHKKTTAERTIKESGAVSFAIMGNIVIITLADTVEYEIWRDGEFQYLGKLPEVPEMDVTTDTVVIETSAGETYYNYNPYDQNNKEKWPLFSKKVFDQCLDECYDQRLYIDNALFIVGLKLFDGSYKYSQLYLINTDFALNVPATFKTIGQLRPENWVGDTAAQMKVEIYAKQVGFIFAEYNLSEWRDVILSVDIFTSGSIMSHKVSKEKLYVFNWDNDNEMGITTKFISEAEIYTPKSMPEIRKEIETCSVFYKIQSYDLKGGCVDEVDNTSPSNLSVQPRLPVNNSNISYGGMNLVYNNKLHNFQSYNLPVFSGNNGYLLFKEKETQDVETFIKVGEEVYKREIKIPKDEKFFTHILSHPTRGVKKQIINSLYDIEFVENDSMDMSVALGYSDEKDYLVTFKPVSMMGTLFQYNNTDTYATINIDTFLNKIGFEVGDYILYQSYNNGDYVCINGEVKSQSINDYGITLNGDSSFYRGQRFYITVRKQKAFYNIDSIIKKNPTESISTHNIKKNTNIFKVSAVDNPFYFPTAQTYKFEGNIVGLASNAEAISMGQFGAYPLYVFTTEGVWAMQTDTSGKGAYVSQTPVSREVCNGCAIAVSGGVVFTTDRGLMMMSSGQVTELSSLLDGTEIGFFEGEIWGKIFAKAGFEAVVNPCPIRDYIKGAKLAYNYLHNEVLMCNKDKGYSYVYNLINQTWSVIDTVFDLTTNSYPELVVYDSEKGKMIEFKDGKDANKVVAITRPFTLGTFDFKRIRQAALRTTFTGRLNFYVLGSMDGGKFHLITGKEYPSVNGNEPTDVLRRDLVSAMSRSRQYRYFIIAIVGEMTGRISMAEMLVDTGFANNKLR